MSMLKYYPKKVVPAAPLHNKINEAFPFNDIQLKERAKQEGALGPFNFCINLLVINEEIHKKQRILTCQSMLQGRKILTSISYKVYSGKSK